MASDFETLVQCVENTLSDDSITFGIFRISESKKDYPRRVVWIPTEFTCHGVLCTNPIYDADTGTPGDSLCTDFITVECQISGITFEDACLIRVAVCNAAKIALGIASRMMDGVYQTEMEGHSGLMWAGGAKIIQRFEWQINVQKPDDRRATVTTIEQTSELGTTDELLTITTP